MRNIDWTQVTGAGKPCEKPTAECSTCIYFINAEQRQKDIEMELALGKPGYITGLKAEMQKTEREASEHLKEGQRLDALNRELSLELYRAWGEYERLSNR